VDLIEHSVLKKNPGGGRSTSYSLDNESGVGGAKMGGVAGGPARAGRASQPS
jgi:hypothetical protein